MKLKISLEDALEEKKIGELLVEKGKLSPEQVNTILKEKLNEEERFGEIALSLDFITEKDLAEVLAEKSGLKYVDLRQIRVESDVARIIAYDLAENYKVLPLYEEGEEIIVAVADPFDNRVKNLFTNYRIRYVVAEPSLIMFIQQKVFNELSYERQIDELSEQAILTLEREGRNTQIPTIPNLVQLLVYKGMADAATDLHLTTDQRSFRIFYRIRGQMIHFRTYKEILYHPIAAYIKTNSGIPPGDPLHIKDGSMSVRIGARSVQLRISKVPTIPPAIGESLVLRILDKNRVSMVLDNLGFFDSDLKLLKKLIANPYGIILVTGPTGSGKTTTLYSILAEKNPFTNTILTIEDPVEYQIPGIRQVQVNEEAGITFASALKAFLRQDPDIILVGEIRDSETAEVAINAALTGHLVFSTLHTNTAIEALSRLYELKVDASVLSASMIAILSQRLVRKLCPFCKEEIPISKEIKEIFEKYKIEPPEKIWKEVKGERCELCGGTGFSSMTVVYEILPIIDSLKEAIDKKMSVIEMKKIAEKEGILNLAQIGLKKVKAGETTFEELERKVLQTL